MERKEQESIKEIGLNVGRDRQMGHMHYEVHK